VRSNPRVSFAIDQYEGDWNKARGIQGDGECLPATGEDMVTALGMFGDKFPSPSSGASTTNIAFFKITPTALQFIDNTGGRAVLSEDEFGMSFHREHLFSDER
jgi:hypothetical protein